MTTEDRYQLTVLVKITAAPLATEWYAAYVGHEFEVYEEAYGDSYILKEDYDLGHRADWRHIMKNDCEVIYIGTQSRPGTGDFTTVYTLGKTIIVRLRSKKRI